MPPRRCGDLLLQHLFTKKVDTAQLDASPTLDGKLLSLFDTLVQTSPWGNAQDAKNIAKVIHRFLCEVTFREPVRFVGKEHTA